MNYFSFLDYCIHQSTTPPYTLDPWNIMDDVQSARINAQDADTPHESEYMAGGAVRALDLKRMLERRL